MFACLLLPDFRLQAALRWREVSGSAAVVDDQSDLLLETNDAARERGITPGLTGPQAMARDARILLLPPALAQEECLNHLLVDRALALSPDVERTLPGAVITDLNHVSKSHCWQRLADELVAHLRAEQLRLRVGLAPTPDLALLAAHGANPTAVVYEASSFAASLPIAALEPSENLRLILADWGITTVGAFLRLPKSGAIERLGAEAQEMMRRVSGRHKRPLRLDRARPQYAEAFDFDYEVETTEPLLFMLRRFLDQLTTRLREVGRVSRQMTLSIPLDDGACHERTFCIPAPTAEVDVLFRVLHTHLETLQLPQRPVGLRLKLEDTVPARDQLQLFESALRDPNLFGETLARLKALVGNDGVGIPMPQDTHRPDSFTLREFFAEKNARESVTPLHLRGLPLRRCRPSIFAHVTIENGQLVELGSDFVSGLIVQSDGPFRLSGDWWDDTRWELEEWDVELADGSLHRLARCDTQWTVEGSYEIC